MSMLNRPKAEAPTGMTYADAAKSLMAQQTLTVGGGPESVSPPMADYLIRVGAAAYAPGSTDQLVRTAVK